MNKNLKALVIVFALIFTTAILTVGCNFDRAGVINTKQMPGHRFSKYRTKANPPNTSSRIVYLGDDSKGSSYNNFGPQDVNFDFRTLR